MALTLYKNNVLASRVNWTRSEDTVLTGSYPGVALIRHRRHIDEEYAAARAAGIDAVPTVISSDGRGRVHVVGEVESRQYHRFMRWFLPT
jgi:hypothetical protein